MNNLTLNNEHFKHSLILGLIPKNIYENSNIVRLISINLGINLVRIEDNKNILLKKLNQNVVIEESYNLFRHDEFLNIINEDFPVFHYKYSYNDVGIYLICNYFKNTFKIIELNLFRYILFFKTKNENDIFINQIINEINSLIEIENTSIININNIKQKGYFYF